ncbi:malate dehydrogenase (NAD) [Paenibacillus cellulosilyticus]|uniref:L-lactate dehydrogenase n=1 Tax=Paenibacillus cellulosilyticus TaxID=375489 RepID=A0A2V2Z3Y8_9BACL|nr:L-lactate dehydrogenase [Paenibacillus cellulosilyticus]PWW08530.1 malate dehydrogenase (NAD) [Paenibacillus cellulosilyticus]QKS48109.1 L-lactate dehydrogenase [Paenibacillus cellulosilyticus]
MGSRPRKVAIIGVGHVGASCAYALINQSICDEIMLVGRTPERAYAQALDLSHCMDFTYTRTKIYTGSWDDCGDADIIILCAGGYPKSGSNRLDLLDSAFELYQEIVPRIMASGFDGLFIAAANPVDIVTQMVWKLSGLPRERVIGTGTSIDTSRLKTLIAEFLPVDPRSVCGYVLGEHGESQFPAWSHVSVGGKPILDILSQHPQRFSLLKLDDIEAKTRNAGWEIYQHKGSTHYGIANAIAHIVRSILNDDYNITAVSAILEGEYGERDVCTGVPAILTRRGIAELVELNLTSQEQARFAHSCAVLRSASAHLAL